MPASFDGFTARLADINNNNSNSNICEVQAPTVFLLYQWILWIIICQLLCEMYLVVSHKVPLRYVTSHVQK